MPRFAAPLLAAAVVACALLPSPAAAQTTWPAPTLQAPARTSQDTPLSQLKGGGPFGLGFVAGTVNGLSLKVWPARGHGFVLNVGGTTRVDALSAEAGYRFHFRPVGDDVTFQVTAGVDFRLRLAHVGGGEVYTELGAGIPLGVSVLKSGLPAELFAEVAPLLIFYEVMGFDVAGRGGVRLYF